MSEESLLTDCKCHGVSGSCSLRTCWKALANLMTIGIELQHRYDTQAIQVVARRAANRTVLVPVGLSKQLITHADFVYDTLSPDYCWPDKALGSYGTHHRYTPGIIVYKFVNFTFNWRSLYNIKITFLIFLKCSC